LFERAVQERASYIELYGAPSERELNAFEAAGNEVMEAHNSKGLAWEVRCDFVYPVTITGATGAFKAALGEALAAYFADGSQYVGIALVLPDTEQLSLAQLELLLMELDDLWLAIDGKAAEDSVYAEYAEPEKELKLIIPADANMIAKPNAMTPAAVEALAVAAQRAEAEAEAEAAAAAAGETAPGGAAAEDPAAEEQGGTEAGDAQEAGGQEDANGAQAAPAHEAVTASTALKAIVERGRPQRLSGIGLLMTQDDIYGCADLLAEGGVAVAMRAPAPVEATGADSPLALLRAANVKVVLCGEASGLPELAHALTAAVERHSFSYTDAKALLGASIGSSLASEEDAEAAKAAYSAAMLAFEAAQAKRSETYSWKPPSALA
jgi:hypothetical protein